MIIGFALPLVGASPRPPQRCVTSVVARATETRFTVHLRLNILASRSMTCVVLTIVTLAAPSTAGTVVVSASKDNTLFNSSTGSFSNGMGPLFAGRTGGMGIGPQRALIAFDLASAIPAGSIITEVQLTLNVLQAGSRSGVDSYALHRVTQDWGEGASDADGGAGTDAAPGDATWIHTFFDTNSWNNPGGDFASSPSAARTIGTSGNQTWGSTTEMVADAQTWLDDSSANFGWILIGSETVPSSSRKFGSRESTNGPSLMVTYIPEPTSLAVLLTGVAVTIVYSRRRTN